MPEAPPKPRAGKLPVPSPGGSGEFWRTRALAAEQELRDRDELAKKAEERGDDFLASIDRRIVDCVAAEVAKAMAGRQSQPVNLYLQTPAPFQPVALAPPILPPAVAPAAPPLLAPPSFAGLPPMRAPVPSATNEQQAVADFAASQQAEQRLKRLGILTVPVCGLLIAVVGSIASYCSATHPAATYAPAPMQPMPMAQPPALPAMRNPPPMLHP